MNKSRTPSIIKQTPNRIKQTRKITKRTSIIIKQIQHKSKDLTINKQISMGNKQSHKTVDKVYQQYSIWSTY